jgi:hypothetical protein
LRSIAIGQDGGQRAPGAGAQALAIESIAIGNDALVDVGADRGIALGDVATVGPGAVDAIAIGTNATALGVNATAIGTAANVTGKNSTAVGAYSYATGGFGSTAVGTNAGSVGYYNSALGQGAYTGGFGNSAAGTYAKALGVGNAAFGTNAYAAGAGNAAVGTGAIAVGAGNTAVGTGATAVGTLNTAVGYSSLAVSPNATAVGANSQAIADNATAVGANTQANQEGSVAIGTDANGDGAISNRDNEFVLGTNDHTYTAPGITSGLSRARQSGPLEVVTSDAGGHLATDGGEIFARLDEAESGIALAMSMEDPDLIGNERFGARVNYGNFEGANALSWTFAGVLGRDVIRAGDRIAIGGGFGVGFEEGRGDDVWGGRVGAQWTWGHVPMASTESYK